MRLVITRYSEPLECYNARLLLMAWLLYCWQRDRNHEFWQAAEIGAYGIMEEALNR